VYVANRAPASLLVGRMTPDFSYANGSSELPSFIDSIALTSGPSRVVLGFVKVPTTAATTMNDPPLEDSGGLYDLERRVFVVCFDSRRIFVYDPKRRVIEANITTGRGPFALAIDQDRGLAYVAHFTDSYLGVISLDQRFPQTYASVVASIGPPSPPRASK
jgi:DNA-binding beta-propeller fold protein YncE